MVSLVEALPSEIIVDITSRLPVKSIINCTLVCKFFKTLIPNPFLAKHNPTYFLLCDQDSARFSILDIDYDDRHNVWKDQVIDMKPSFSGYNDIIVFGSCNGLVCFSKRVNGATLNIYLYNPVLGQPVTVPKPSSNYSLDTISERYAFGFCPVTNHYKVFRSVYHVGDDDHDNAEVEIYTIGSPGWRHIGHVPKELRVWSSPVCARGSLHWIRSGEEDELKLTSIFNFNLATEEFGWTPPPPIGRGEIMYVLGHMDRCLVATAGPVEPVSCTDIWMRKESAWSKNWVFHDTNIHHLQNLEPLAISTDGIILMTLLSSWLYSLDPKDKRGTLRLVSDYVPRIGSWSDLVPHDATLVSPRDLMKGV